MEIVDLRFVKVLYAGDMPLFLSASAKMVNILTET